MAEPAVLVAEPLPDARARLTLAGRRGLSAVLGSLGPPLEAGEILVGFSWESGQRAAERSDALIDPEPARAYATTSIAQNGMLVRRRLWRWTERDGWIMRQEHLKNG